MEDPFVEWNKSQEPVGDEEVAREAADTEEKTRRIARELKLPPKQKEIFDKFADMEAELLLREKKSQQQLEEAKTKKMTRKLKKSAGS
ncbi:MAG: hypothetical protein AAB345_01630 [Patescibacteria group bacterium]